MTTRHQSEALAFIKRYNAERGYSPSYDEISDALGIKSKSGITRIVKALAAAGMITHRPNRSRAIEVIDKGPQLAGHPLDSLHPLSIRVAFAVDAILREAGIAR